VLLLLNCMFLFASTAALSTVALHPTLSRLSPSLQRTLIPIPAPPILKPIQYELCGEATAVPLAQLLSLAAAFATALTWFMHRHGTWAWLAQDALSMCVCVLFVQTLRLPSLRVAAIFLGLMFAYDIFMVFISPLIFHTSIMLAVATAGEATATPAHGVCVRSEGESMPMLMSVPRLAPIYTPTDHIYTPPLPSPPPPPAPPITVPIGSLLWRLSGAHGAYAMLGLGDIVLPALALAYARRVDLARRSPRTPIMPATSACTALLSAALAPLRTARTGGYYVWAVVGYALGLIITQAANVYGWTFNDVQGQPALLYLVPGVIGSQVVRAICMREISSVWSGEALLTSSLSDAHAEASSTDHAGSTARLLPRRGGCCCDYKRL